MMSLLLTVLMLGPEAVPPAGCNPPRAKMDAWVHSSDYPEEARTAGMEGAVEVTLQIDKMGCPTACEVTVSSGHPVLDNRTCTLLMERLRLKPKLDDNWKPIPTTSKRKTYWKLAL